MERSVTIELSPQIQFGSKGARSRVDYSSRATDPGPGYEAPLPGTDAFRRVRGRSGDLILVQLKSGNNETRRRRDALRSLGLGQVHSAILRESSEPTLWGNVAVVRDMIAVIILPRREFAVGDDMSNQLSNAEYESLKYGTATRPGHLWRAMGQYFAFEFESESLVSFWSTDYSLSEVVDSFGNAGLSIDKGSDEAKVRVVIGDGRSEQRTGFWSEIANLGESDGHLSEAVIGTAVIPMDNGTRVVWRAGLKRFHDINSYRRDVTIASSPPDVVAIRGLARETCSQGFLERVPCRLMTRLHGRVREYPVEPKSP